MFFERANLLFFFCVLSILRNRPAKIERENERASKRQRENERDRERMRERERERERETATQREGPMQREISESLFSGLSGSRLCPYRF